MNKIQLLVCLEKMDAALAQPMQLYIYGSAAFMLLDEPDRISLDVDVAAPFCDDPMLWDNWRNFQADLALWRKESL